VFRSDFRHKKLWKWKTDVDVLPPSGWARPKSFVRPRRPSTQVKETTVTLVIIKKRDGLIGFNERRTSICVSLFHREIYNLTVARDPSFNLINGTHFRWGFGDAEIGDQAIYRSEKARRSPAAFTSPDFRLCPARLRKRPRPGPRQRLWTIPPLKFHSSRGPVSRNINSMGFLQD